MKDLTVLEREKEREVQYWEQRGKFEEAGFTGYGLTLAMNAFVRWRDDSRQNKDGIFNATIEDLETRFLKGK